MSGLKINITKTKVIRIGPIRETDRRFCRENDLEWVTEFVALGIKYNVLDMENITINNISEKIDSMKKQTQLWLYRNITPIGRVCISKSLILSQIIHILQTLPTPEKTFFKQIENLCVDFIWKNKRHEINKTLLCKSIKKGGMAMIDLYEFDMSLKITWVRKIEQGNPDWIDFAKKFKIDRLTLTDEIYHKKLASLTSNPFWKSVIIAYSKWYVKFNKNADISTNLIHIWGNPRINIPFNSDLYLNKMVYLQDLFTENGIMRTKEQLEELTGTRVMMTTYFSLRKAIPKQWTDELKDITRTYKVNLPKHVKWLLKDKKGTSNIRKIFNEDNTEIPKGQIKWEIEFGNEVLDSDFLYNLPNLCKQNARTKYFQFQVLHRTLITNKKLHQFNIRDNEICEHCGMVETISHLLYECVQSQEIWNNLKIWLNAIMAKPVTIEKSTILLGSVDNEIIINYIFIIVKHEIYKSKWNRTETNLIKIKKILKSHMDLDIYLGTIKKCLPKILGKWSSVYNNLKNI